MQSQPARKYCSILLILLAWSLSLHAQNVGENPGERWKLLHMLSPDEMNQKVQLPTNQFLVGSPSQPLESIAEYEPMAGALVVHAGELRFNLLAEITKKDTLYVLMRSSEDSFWQALSLYEYDRSRIKIIPAKSDSHWTRDFGPMFVAGKDSIGITDFVYNRVRPLDNKIPALLAEQMNVSYYWMSVVHSGGNYMTDGWGVAASTPLFYSESAKAGIAREEVDRQVKEFLGIKNYLTIENPNNDYIHHIDCFAKFLDVDKVMVRSVPPTHPQFSEIEKVADYFRNQLSSWGNNYQVFRVYTPNNEPYTNSFILNKRVFVPTMGTEFDNAALQAYREAMPGYEVLGFMGSWYSTDALHCRVHEMADKQMIRIKHKPMDSTGDVSSVKISAEIKAYSGKPLYADSVQVFFQQGSEVWQSKIMTGVGDNRYEATIGGLEPGSELHYYIRAVDEVGKKVVNPVVGASAPYSYPRKDVVVHTAKMNYSPQINLFPNPVRDFLNISFASVPYGSACELAVYSVDGTCFWQDFVRVEEIYRIDMSKYLSGIYIVRIKIDNSISTYKVIKAD